MLIKSKKSRMIFIKTLHYVTLQMKGQAILAEESITELVGAQGNFLLNSTVAILFCG